MFGPSLTTVGSCSAALIALVMLVAWVWSVRRRDAGVVDLFWGVGFVLVAWSSYLAGQAQGPRRLLVPLLVTVWGLRLSGYLVWRNLVVGLQPVGDLDEVEDRRYRALRRRHGHRFWWVSLFSVFGLQGALLWFVSMPLQAVQAIPGRTNLDWVDYLGVLMVSVGLFFETVGDWQLSVFRMNPGSHGEVLNTGLWRYTRHPNYFGDFLVWWGFFVVAASSGVGVWVTVLSPIVMSILLIKVSGVALTEATIAVRRPRYREYVAATSAFIPWLPRRTVTAVPDTSSKAETSGTRAAES